MTFRPGADRGTEVAALHAEFLRRGWFRRSDGQLTEMTRYGVFFDELVTVLARSPLRCPDLVQPHGSEQQHSCWLPEDRLITVPGTSHNSGEHYVAATCSDLHLAAERPRVLWKVAHVGHWADGAWHLLADVRPVRDDELERRARLVRRAFIG